MQILVLSALKVDTSLQPVGGGLGAKTAAASFAPSSSVAWRNSRPRSTRYQGSRHQCCWPRGGRRPIQTVAGAIVERALKFGRPSMVLISETELRGIVFPPNLTALDKRSATIAA